jgi:hypothetical protein
VFDSPALVIPPCMTGHFPEPLDLSCTLIYYLFLFIYI